MTIRWTLRRRHEALALAALLALHGWLALSSSLDKSAVFDEIAHLGGGVMQWHAGDYRFNAESGVLPQRWAAWPLAGRAHELPEIDGAALGSANVWRVGREILYGEERDPATQLLAGRSMIAWASLALGVLVYLWSRALFGVAGAMLSLALYALSPTMLAHARLITSDLVTAFFFLSATGAIWRLLTRVTWLRLLGAVLAVAGLLLSKMSGLLILPIAAILILVRLSQGQRIVLDLGRSQRTLVESRNQITAILGVALLVGGGVLGTVWAAYGLRYAADPNAPPSGSQFLHPWESLLDADSLPIQAVRVARDASLLPEAYLWGLAYTFDTTRGRDAFLRGQTRETGWWWFFPYALAVKTPLGLFGLLGLAVLAWRREVSDRQPSDRGSLAFPLWTLIAVYGLVAVSSQINIGHRHLLPIYPALFIFAGGAGRWLTQRRRLASALVLLCLAAVAWDSWAIRPHYLSFFNTLAGGSEQGYRHLADSSLDWGQDLPALATRIEAMQAEEGNEGPVFAGLFGTAPPEAYGVDAVWLYSFFSVGDPRRPPPPLTGGIYCVSVTLLQTLHMELLGPWTNSREQALAENRELVERFRRLSTDDAGRKQLRHEHSPGEWMQIFRAYDRLRSGKLYRYLQDRPTDARAGYSIHLYRLSDEEVDQALNGSLPQGPQ
ncbi:MAG: hypothetical protein AAF657_02950 [Acidobacteriota bacterium]